MRLPVIPVLILFLIIILIDIYIYCCIRARSKSKFLRRLQLWSSIAINAFMLYIICAVKRTGPDSHLVFVMWGLWAVFTIYVPKIIFIVFDLLSKIPQLFHQKRIKVLGVTGMAIGATVFVIMWWGALVNRYHIDIKRVEIVDTSLPSQFEGYTIAQISDIHVGTYGSDTAFVSKLVDSINALKPDVIVFTGDVVNRNSRELKPFIPVFARLHAPAGVYGVLGNHDYGDYMDWPADSDKIADRLQLAGYQKQMGWQMLNNSTLYLRPKDGYRNDSIALIGVGNVGDPPFKIYGSLHKAYPQINDRNFKILLSHNPMHWQDSIRNRDDSNIALTLSGHTHAMQMTFFGWSPAVFRYPVWGGLYEDSQGKKLYVNIGSGEVGFPARIGATPEITLFTLRKSPAIKN